MSENVCNECKRTKKTLTRIDIKISPFKNFDNIKIDAHLCESCTSLAILAFVKKTGVSGRALESIISTLEVKDETL